jgi:hypothetical protein
MLKDLLSDLSIVINPHYQPYSFQPYLSMILTIITFTIVAYTIQTATTTIYSYTNNPTLFKNKVHYNLCEVISRSPLSICNRISNNSIKNYEDYSLLSFEHDLHKLIN